MNVTIHTDKPQEAASHGEFVMPSPLPGLSWEQTRALGEQITVVVPYRSAEGIHPGICTHFPIWAGFGIQIAEVKDPHGGFIEVVRAGIVRVFLDQRKRDPNRKYLIMIDNDEGVQWDTPLRLARHDVPVCTGVVCGYTDEKGIFACFTVKGKDGGAYFPTLKYTGIMPAEGLVEVHQCGTGLVCIRHDVLEYMLDCGDIPFYIPEDIRRQAATSGDLRKSEDIVFADLCEKYGYKRYVDLSVQAIHYKNIGISWPHDRLDPNLRPEDWEVKPHNPER